MPWNTSDLHEIRDRVHRDIKAMLSTGTIEVREEGDVLLARHEHYTNRIEVVPPGQAAPADPPSLGMLKVTTDVPAAVTDVLRGRFFPGAPEGM